ncbi:alpha/beta hydrolase family protein [Brevifollis gellanilyticus]|uniref:Acetylxylan esterase n=1 Tax=Brevifollis gellanilyticus TaxID=748831 RepID=A0A512M6U7_9BACT|nr:acetylxylan esterase [Brevifollis gellanilyticus]GEP42443.1 acetylxylan esterase [Brevifollis gellanilyticus]
MKLPPLLLAAAGLSLSQAADVRLEPPKDLNGYFPFSPPSSLSEWDARKDYVKRQILVAEGLWPMPTKTPLNAVIHGKVDCGEYTVEKVYFESVPGFYVTGSLYRPKNPKGKVPGVMFAHGHWQDARLSLTPPDKVRAEISTGGERFEKGGQSMFQSLCVQLARMGCVVWQWDMLSDSDSIQIPREVVHTFAKQRPEMNTTENWGLFSPQAESNLQSIMGLQTLNAERGLDFLLSLPEVDPERTAITGASGGGTQTMLLAAIDDRIKLSFPCVMVSTSMQGGCTCENASLLRINTGNVEFAGLFAPKPQGMNTANDWTKEFATKGYPDLQKLYTTFGKKDNVFLLRGEHFPHNYNAVTRSAFYTFLNKHFKLGFPSPVIEQDYEPLTREQLTVWDDKHPAPKAKGPEFERALLKWLTEDANKQLASAEPTVLKQGIEVTIGRSYDKAGEVEWDLKDKQGRAGHLEMTGTLTNKTYGEELNVTWLYPKQWNGRAVIWLDDKGQSGLKNDEVTKLVQGGTTVIGVDLLFQGGEPVTQTRMVKNPREFAGYTHGYNHALFAQRVHDVLSIVSFLRRAKVGSHESPKTVCLAGFGKQTGPIALAARALAGEAVDRAAVNTHGFRFGKILDYRDPMFIPGGSKYLDLPGFVKLNGSHPLWLQGEGKEPEGSSVEWLQK